MKTFEQDVSRGNVDGAKESLTKSLRLSSIISLDYRVILKLQANDQIKKAQRIHTLLFLAAQECDYIPLLLFRDCHSPISKEDRDQSYCEDSMLSALSMLKSEEKLEEFFELMEILISQKTIPYFNKEKIFLFACLHTFVEGMSNEAKVRFLKLFFKYIPLKISSIQDIDNQHYEKRSRCVGEEEVTYEYNFTTVLTYDERCYLIKEGFECSVDMIKKIIEEDNGEFLNLVLAKQPKVIYHNHLLDAVVSEKPKTVKILLKAMSTNPKLLNHIKIAYEEAKKNSILPLFKDYLPLINAATKAGKITNKHHYPVENYPSA